MRDVEGGAQSESPYGCVPRNKGVSQTPAVCAESLCRTRRAARSKKATARPQGCPRARPVRGDNLPSAPQHNSSVKTRKRAPARRERETTQEREREPRAGQTRKDGARVAAPRRLRATTHTHTYTRTRTLSLAIYLCVVRVCVCVCVRDCMSGSPSLTRSPHELSLSLSLLSSNAR